MSKQRKSSSSRKGQRRRAAPGGDARRAGPAADDTLGLPFADSPASERQPAADARSEQRGDAALVGAAAHQPPARDSAGPAMPVHAAPADCGVRDKSLRAALTARTRSRRVRRILLLAGPPAGLAAAALLIWWQSARPPAWYAPPQYAPARQQVVRDQLQHMADQFSALLLAGAPFAVEFREEDVNAWITLRDRVWPALRDVLPPEIGTPLVHFDDNGVTVAATWRRGAREFVASARVGIAIENDELVVRCLGARIGRVPIPLSWIPDGVARARIEHRDRRSRVEVRGTLADGIRVNTRHVWWNGRIEYELQDVTIEPGVLRAVIRPLGPAERKPRT